MIQKLSPNFTKGRDGHEVSGIVLHITDSSLNSALDWFSRPESQVSCHYLLGVKNGNVETYQIVKEEDTAWHAGLVVSPTWKGLKPGINPNKYTIGIETALKVGEFPSIKLWFEVARLVKELYLKYPLIILDERGIANHREIRANKTCPGSYITRSWIVNFIKLKLV